MPDGAVDTRNVASRRCDAELRAQAHDPEDLVSLFGLDFDTWAWPPSLLEQAPPRSAEDLFGMAA